MPTGSKDDPQIAESRDAQGVSALLWAVYSGQVLVRDFLRSGLELDLPEAAAVGDVEAACASCWDLSLRRRGSGQTARSADGWPLLHLAAAFADRETVATLLDAGAEVQPDFARRRCATTALHALLALSRGCET